MEVRAETLTEVKVIVWHSLKGELLLEWMERAKENFEIYPQPGGQSGDAAVLKPMIGAVASFLRQGKDQALGFLLAICYEGVDPLPKLWARHLFFCA